jgi:hypothetical protein
MSGFLSKQCNEHQGWARPAFGSAPAQRNEGGQIGALRVAQGRLTVSDSASLKAF